MQIEMKVPSLTARTWRAWKYRQEIREQAEDALVADAHDKLLALANVYKKQAETAINTGKDSAACEAFRAADAVYESLNVLHRARMARNGVSHNLTMRMIRRMGATCWSDLYGRFNLIGVWRRGKV